MNKEDIAKKALKELWELIQEWVDKCEQHGLKVSGLTDFAIYNGEELLEAECKSTLNPQQFNRNGKPKKNSEPLINDPKMLSKIKELLLGIEIMKNNIPPPKEQHEDIYLRLCRINNMVKILMEKDKDVDLDLVLELLYQVYMSHIYIVFENNVTYKEFGSPIIDSPGQYIYAFK